MHPRAALATRLSSPVTPARPPRTDRHRRTNGTDATDGRSPVLGRDLQVGFAVVTVMTVLYPLLPWDGVPLLVYYNGLGWACVLFGLIGLRRQRPARRRGWRLVLLGYSGWVIGDLIWTLESVTIPDVYPAFSDIAYLSAYLLIGAGVLSFVTSRDRRDRSALLDAAIVTTGAGVLAVVFLVLPMTGDSTLSVLARTVTAAYPLGDLFLLGVIARLFASAVARTASFRLLASSLVVILVTDVTWNYEVARSGDFLSSRWVDTGWQVGYLLVALAACLPSMRRLAEPSEGRIDAAALTGRRRVALGAGLSLPGIALLLDGATNLEVSWLVIGIGTLLLSGLVLVRMLGLLGTVQDQASRLAELAHSDGLTGAPNRRTWDVELAAACAVADERGTQLDVALIDLDRFKVFNDTHGHPAGDRLLREAVAIWSTHLPDGALLARYGGEEFAVLFPGPASPDPASPDLDRTQADAVAVVQAMRTSTPDRQTFSAGVARRPPGQRPDLVIEAADEALYAAKRAGRDRVVVAGAGNPDPAPLPEVTIVTQPVVDVVTSVVTGHEALSRFPARDGADIQKIFRRAHAEGIGDLLELAAVRTALELPGRPEGHDLYVNVTARALTSARFMDGLPGDLTGIVFELGEQPDDVPLLQILPMIEQLRDRGARIALDDIGGGAEEFARLAALRPEIVKVDRSLVDGCAEDPGRTAVLCALVTYAAQTGAVVCGEGVENAADLAHLRLLGVPLAQGYFLARPAPGWKATLDAAVPAQRRAHGPDRSVL